MFRTLIMTLPLLALSTVACAEEPPATPAPAETPSTPTPPAAEKPATPDFVALDLDENKVLTQPEVEVLPELHKAFANVDVDKNQLISVDEFDAWMKTRKG